MKYLRNLVHKLSPNNSRDNLILKNIVASFLIKGGALFLAFLTMPAYMIYFDDQQVLGLWFTLLSVLSWVLTFDMGLGNGLRNHLVQAIVENNPTKIRKYISSAYLMIGCIVTAFMTVNIIAFPYVSWNSVFNVSEDVISRATLLTTVQIVFAGILIQFLFRLIVSVLFALQKAAVPGFLGILTNSMLLIFVMTANLGSTEANLKLLAQVNVLAVNAPLLLASIWIFSTSLKSCSPSVLFFDKGYAFDVVKLGGIFFWLQIMYMLIANTDSFLISWLSGPEYVVDYQIYNKPFMLISTVFTLALTPIWSAVTQATAEGDYKWISVLYRRLKLLAIATIVGQFIMVIILQPFINVWLGNLAIDVNMAYALIFAVSNSMFVWNGVISSIVNGTGRLKIQFILLTVGVLIKFPVAFILTGMTGAWIGVVISDIFAMFLYCLIQPIWINKHLKELMGGNKQAVVHTP